MIEHKIYLNNFLHEYQEHPRLDHDLSNSVLQTLL